MDDLKTRARRAYEVGRLRSALAWGLASLPLAVLLGLAGVALPVVVVALRWWGRAAGAAVPAGLTAGSVAVLLPALGLWTGLYRAGCGATFACLTTCSVTAVCAGGLCARLAPRDALVPAVLLTVTIAAMSSLPLGLGVMALTVVLLLATAPVARRVLA